jgi:hypothetical protein
MGQHCPIPLILRNTIGWFIDHHSHIPRSLKFYSVLRRIRGKVAEWAPPQCYNPAVPPDTPLTKRQLGWLVIAGGILLAFAGLGADLLGAGRFSGLGPAQRQALVAAGLIIAFGITFLPLGQRPA